jgi:hypothetical protein
MTDQDLDTAEGWRRLVRQMTASLASATRMTWILAGLVAGILTVAVLSLFGGAPRPHHTPSTEEIVRLLAVAIAASALVLPLRSFLFKQNFEERKDTIRLAEEFLQRKQTSEKEERADSTATRFPNQETHARQ